MVNPGRRHVDPPYRFARANSLLTEAKLLRTEAKLPADLLRLFAELDPCQFPAMRFNIFFSGATIVAMGVAAMSVLDRSQSIGFLQGALTLGGGILICGIFSMKMRWHGIIGAGILALLGAARGVGNVPDMAKFIVGDRPRGTAPVMETGVTLICLLLLVKIIRALSQERLRRMLESQD